jgi:hypothetical protein
MTHFSGPTLIKVDSINSATTLWLALRLFPQVSADMPTERAFDLTHFLLPDAK